MPAPTRLRRHLRRERMRLSGTESAAVASRFVHVRMSRSPSIGGTTGTEPVERITARRALTCVRVPSSNSTSTVRGPAMTPVPRTRSIERSSSQATCPLSSHPLVIVSRRASAAGAWMSPETASRAPGTLRAAATTLPGRSSPLLGMQPQNEHSPQRARARRLRSRGRPPHSIQPPLHHQGPLRERSRRTRSPCSSS